MEMVENLLGRLLIENKFITEEQLEAALKKQKNSPEHKLLGEILVEEGLVTQRALDTILSVQRHRRDQKEMEAAGDSGSEGPQATPIQPHEIDSAQIERLKKEIKDEIMEEIEKHNKKFHHDIMDEVRRLVKRQVKRAK
jgi:hypothetical protein